MTESCRGRKSSLTKRASAIGITRWFGSTASARSRKLFSSTARATCKKSDCTVILWNRPLLNCWTANHRKRVSLGARTKNHKTTDRVLVRQVSRLLQCLGPSNCRVRKDEAMPRGTLVASCAALFVACTLALALTISSAAASPASYGDTDETVHLFNGTDLTNFYTWLVDFHYDDPHRVFSVVDAIDGVPAIRVSGQ